MKVGISHLITPGMPLEEFFKKAAAAEYEVVELVIKREGELTPKSSDADLKRIADLSAQYKLPIVSLCLSHCTGNLLDSGANQRTSIDETILGLQVAKNLGIGCTLHTLGRLNKDLFYDDAYRNAVSALKEISKSANSLGVTLAVEFVWNGFLFSPLEMKRFLDEIGSERIGFYFDPGNMAVFNFPQHWARIVGKHIKMVHMKDWKGNALNGSWPALLKGNCDYAAINKELRTAGYDGPMISEVELKEASMEESAASIRKIINL